MDNSDLSRIWRKVQWVFQSHKYYSAEMEELKMFAIPGGLNLKDSENVDKLLVDYMNGLGIQFSLPRFPAGCISCERRRSQKSERRDVQGILWGE